MATDSAQTVFPCSDVDGGALLQYKNDFFFFFSANPPHPCEDVNSQPTSLPYWKNLSKFIWFSVMLLSFLLYRTHTSKLMQRRGKSFHAFKEYWKVGGHSGNSVGDCENFLGLLIQNKLLALIYNCEERQKQGEVSSLITLIRLTKDRLMLIN